MKPTTFFQKSFFFVLLSGLLALPLSAQQRADVPNTTDKFREVSMYATTLPTRANALSVSMEHTYVVPNWILGYNYGVFFNLNGQLGTGFGNHAALMAAKEWNRHRLELHAGAAAQWFHQDAAQWRSFWEIRPLAMLAYRVQIPAKPWYFRVGVGTTGIGMGLGYTLRP